MKLLSLCICICALFLFAVPAPACHYGGGISAGYYAAPIYAAQTIAPAQFVTPPVAQFASPAVAAVTSACIQTGAYTAPFTAGYSAPFSSGYGHGGYGQNLAFRQRFVGHQQIGFAAPVVVRQRNFAFRGGVRGGFALGVTVRAPGIRVRVAPAPVVRQRVIIRGR